MPADLIYEPVSPNAKETPHYGCYNLPRPILGQPVPHSQETAEETRHVFKMSTECMYDRTLIDNRCTGCNHVGEYEKAMTLRNMAKV